MMVDGAHIPAPPDAEEEGVPMQIPRTVFSNRPKVQRKERGQRQRRARLSKRRDFAKGKRVRGKLAPWR